MTDRAHGQDHAIIVGIDHYRGPGLDQLSGARNDARYFRDWLLNRGVDGKNIKIHYFSSNREFHTPAKDTIEDVFLDFVRNFRDKNETGRRLYLFFSGHGVEPFDFNEDQHVLVLMANAAADSLGHSVAPLRAARLFHKCSIFEEVILFADCCRTPCSQRVPVDFGFEGALDQFKPKGGGRLLYGMATRWPLDAREAELPDPSGEGTVWRGLFTYALLEALSCAEDPSIPGFVTGRSAQDYLERHLPGYGRMGDIPRLAGDLDVVIGHVLKPRVLVTVSLAGGGRSIEVRHGKYLDTPLNVHITTRTDGVLEVPLPRGIYLIGPSADPGDHRSFSGTHVTVDGDGPVHVQLG